MKKITLILFLISCSLPLLAAQGDMAFYSPNNGSAPQAVVINLNSKTITNFTHNGTKWVQHPSNSISVVKKDQSGNWLVYIQGSTRAPLVFSGDWGIYYAQRAKWYRR